MSDETSLLGDISFSKTLLKKLGVINETKFSNVNQQLVNVNNNNNNNGNDNDNNKEEVDNDINLNSHILSHINNPSWTHLALNIRPLLILPNKQSNQNEKISSNKSIVFNLAAVIPQIYDPSASNYDPHISEFYIYERDSSPFFSGFSYTSSTLFQYSSDSQNNNNNNQNNDYINSNPMIVNGDWNFIYKSTILGKTDHVSSNPTNEWTVIVS